MDATFWPIFAAIASGIAAFLSFLVALLNFLHLRKQSELESARTVMQLLRNESGRGISKTRVFSLHDAGWSHSSIRKGLRLLRGTDGITAEEISLCLAKVDDLEKKAKSRRRQPSKLPNK